MTPTLDEIRRRGFAALRKELGQAGMLRFMQQFHMGSGDYSKDRHAWVDATSLDDLRATAEKRRRPTKRSAKRGS